jgi:hypothetical protein
MEATRPRWLVRFRALAGSTSTTLRAVHRAECSAPTLAFPTKLARARQVLASFPRIRPWRLIRTTQTTLPSRQVWRKVVDQVLTIPIHSSTSSLASGSTPIPKQTLELQIKTKTLADSLSRGLTLAVSRQCPFRCKSCKVPFSLWPCPRVRKALRQSYTNLALPT